MYVGTLTADEMSFAGATGSTNYTHYLMNSYTKNNYLSWWGLSPYYNHAEFGNDYVFLLNIYSGSLNSNMVDYPDYRSRPAVSLKSNTQISSGNGTIENPYIIK